MNQQNTHTHSGFIELQVPGCDEAAEYRIQSAATYNSRLILGIAAFSGDEEEAGETFLLAYDPEEEQWEELYRAAIEPQVVRRNGLRHPLPFELGLKAMAEHQGALYISLVSLKQPLLLRLEGEQLEELSPPDAPFGSLLSWNGHLFGAAVGRLSDSTKLHEHPCHAIYMVDDPRHHAWEAISEPGFGDANNQLITQLLTHDGRLCATVANPANGFQLWQADSGLEEWQLLLDEGALLYSLNPALSAATVFQGRLYLGSGLPEGQPDPGGKRYGCELLRMDEDCWELLVGSPRFSPCGLQVPLSAQSDGFDQREQSNLTVLSAYGGRLFAATTQRLNEGRRRGRGFQLWSSNDGEEWQRLEDELFESPQADGVRVLLPTPWGLLVAGSWRVGVSGQGLCCWLGK